MATSHCLPSLQLRAIALAGSAVIDTQDATSWIEAYAARVHDFIKIAKQVEVTYRFVRPALKRVVKRQSDLISCMQQGNVQTWNVDTCKQVADIFDELLREESETVASCMTRLHWSSRVLVKRTVEHLRVQIRQLEDLNVYIGACSIDDRGTDPDCQEFLTMLANPVEEYDFSTDNGRRSVPAYH